MDCLLLVLLLTSLPCLYASAVQLYYSYQFIKLGSLKMKFRLLKLMKMK